MSSLKTRVWGSVLILLVLTTCFTQSLVSRVMAQGGDYEAFLGRLEGYLRDALPSESDPVEECEYIVPEGFDASQAERLWRVFASSVSMGCSEQDLRSEVENIYPNGTVTLDVNGTPALLNLTGLRVEKPDDGSVRIRIPLESSVPLNYTHYNSTGVTVMYETWNETLVRLYEVEKYTGLYRYVVKDVEKGVVFDIVSRLAVSVFPGFILEKVMLAHPEENWPWFLGNPVVAVPGHYEEVKTLVPEHEEKLRVLFPAYDPVILEGWIVTTSVSSTSLAVGETLEASYFAEYSSAGGPEPLNATLTLSATDGLEPLDGVERRLNDTHTAGVFTLRAVKPGLHNITLLLAGNALLATWPPGSNVTYSILVVGPASPSVTISVLSVDPSILKHAGLILELSNNGGSAARGVTLRVKGPFVEALESSVGDVNVGETRRVELTLRMLQASSEITVTACYRDDDGNNYFSEAETWVWTRSIWVPEHFEEIRVVVPEHEETVRVFVPDCNHYTHVRFFRLTFDYPGGDLLQAIMPTFQGHYGGLELVSRLTPTGAPELNASSWGEALEKARMVMLSLEPYWETLGVFEEGEAALLTGFEPGTLRVNGSLGEYRVRLVNQFWRTSGSILMNSTVFTLYNETVCNHIVEKGLQSEFKLCWNKITNASRLSQPSDEKGFLTLVYRPLTVRGSGPIRSIQVRNYAGFNASYVMRVQQFGRQAYPDHPPMLDLYSGPLAVRGCDYNVTLAGLNAAEGYTYLVRLMYGSSLVAQTVFILNPEQSPFWGCFWSEVKARIPWILATSTIIILVGFLTGHGATAAYAGLAVSTVSTLLHLAGGTLLNWGEIEQCLSAYGFYNSLAERFREWSFELSNYTPPSQVEPPTGPPGPRFKPFEPKGPLAELYWSYSQYFTGVSARLLEDTVLDLVAGCGVTDFETAMSPEAGECERGRATGRIVGAALSFAAFIIAAKIASIEAKAANSKKPWSLVSTVKAWATPAIYDLAETLVRNRGVITLIASNPEQALSIGKFLFFRGLKTLEGRALEAWGTVKNELNEAVEKIEAGIGKVEDFASIVTGRLKDFVGFHDEAYRFAMEVGQEETVGLSHAFDGGGLEVPEQAETFRELNGIVSKSREAAEAVSKWLRLIEEGGLREALEIVEGIGRLEESVLKDVGEAWRLNENVDDFKGLLKGLSFTPDYPAQGRGFYDLLHECVESRSLERLRFLERGYGWIAEVREMELEPGQKPAKIVENSFPFVRDVLNTLDGDCLRKISDILDNLLESRGKKGAYDEMLRLKRHLFVDIRLGEEEPKVWLVEECLEKWVEASRLSDAVVSHQGIDARGHYTARSPVKVNYLDAGDGKVIPIIAAEDTEGGFGITIPEDAAEYLWLKDEGFIIFFKDLPQSAEVILPIKAESDGKVAITRHLERLFKAELPNDPEYSGFIQDREINWGAFEEHGILLRFKAVEPVSGMLVEKIFVITDPGGESIRIRVGEEFASKLLVFKDFEFLKAEWLVERLRELGFSDEMRHRFMELYGSAMALKEDELYRLAGSDDGINDACGRLGEGKTALFIAEKKGGGYIVELRKTQRLGGERIELDIVTINELLDTKYWNEESFRINIVEANEALFKEKVIDGLVKYEVMKNMLGKKKVFLVFVKEMPEELFKLGEARIRNALGGDTGWLKIINGLDNLDLEAG